jgi:hypothetical protein
MSAMKTLIGLTVVGIVALFSARIGAQHVMPANMSHQEHLRQLQEDEALKHRGKAAMGFDQDASVHHFLLQPKGGSIVVVSRDPRDATLIAQIRTHFRDIASAFGQGLFDKPLATHAEMPPGAAVMAEQRDKILYRYVEQPDGARVVLETSDAATLAAIHTFLRYQIVEHKTRDPLTVR